MATKTKKTKKTKAKSAAPKAKRPVKPKVVAAPAGGAPVAQDSAAAPSNPLPAFRIRMYRLGVGDCFVLSLPKPDGSEFKILIDCGVHQSQPGGPARIQKVVANLAADYDGKFDVVVGTHAHYDHLCGFLVAEEAFRKMTAGEIWCAWTEDGSDPLANELHQKTSRTIKALALARGHAVTAGDSDVAEKLEGLLGFIGDNSGVKLQNAGKVLRSLSSKVMYRKPGEDPIEVPGGRIFVLGPPRDLSQIKIADPRGTGDASEGYPFGAYFAATEALEFACSGGISTFDDRYGVTIDGSKSETFFQRAYWSNDSAGDGAPDREDTSQAWRRIDTDWLNSATSLALAADKDVNNTSLVIAVELSEPNKDGPVLLFAADAQVGNWLSWQEVEWPNYHGRKITGPDLLRRTVVYKVGHHASQNATLRALGLEMMDAVELALVPTDAAMAAKVKWGTLPWPALLTALDEKTKDHVIRTDKPAPAQLGRFKLNADSSADALYYEIAPKV